MFSFWAPGARLEQQQGRLGLGLNGAQVPTGTEGLRSPLADEEEHAPESHSPGCTAFEGCWVLLWPFFIQTDFFWAEYQRSGIADNLAVYLVALTDVAVTEPKCCSHVHCIRNCTNAPKVGYFPQKSPQPVEERAFCTVNIMGSFLLHFGW